MAKTVSFDKENDILTIHKGFSLDEKFKGNLVAGDLILDISTKGRVKGIEILNATGFFKDFKIERRFMENLSDANFNAIMKPSGTLITLILKSQSIEREIPMKVAVPMEMPAQASR